MRERLSPAPEPPLKITPSPCGWLRIDSIVSSTARMKQALTCCGLGVPTLNQTGVEAEHLVQQHPGQLVREHLGVGLGGEVALLDAGPVVNVHHPVDELLQARLALRGRRPLEVLGGDDVRRVDRPELGNSTPRCSKLTEPSASWS